MQQRMTAAQYREQFGSQPASSKSRNGKFNAKRVITEDGSFDSKQEYKRFLELKLLLRAGEIQNLRLQVPFDLTVDSIHINKYVADFVYEQGGKTVVEDSKGYITPEYRLKRRLMKEILGIEILETGIKGTFKKPRKRGSGKAGPSGPGK